MDKVYKHINTEQKWYEFWEKSGFFTPKIEKRKKPFTVIMPPPNANGSLHIGHAAFLTIEDIMIRYNRMKGVATLWLPGADHAGILTQVVFERKIEKEGKSRYDLGREKFFEDCMKFTLSNKKTMVSQMKAIGASCDWTRDSFTLDPKFNKPINRTFKRLFLDGLLYRSERLINWCVRCQTALSDLEVIYKKQTDPLFYIKYGPMTLATVRPETKFGDTAIAVNPKDKRYQRLIGKKIEAEGLLGKFKILVIADENVDMKFGTGVVKVTPAHDPVDFDMGVKHKLEIKRVIDFDGRLNKKTGKYEGLEVYKARKIIAQDLKKMDLLEKADQKYSHAVSICERCKTVIEPMVSLQWFIKTKPLAKKAIEAVKDKKIKIHPKRFEKNYNIWMENIRDWCISRQLWWGHRLPVWYCGRKGLSPLQLSMNPELRNMPEGCGKIIIDEKTPDKCPDCKNNKLIRDPDTFDTWFSSGQWPYTTLGFGSKNDQDYKYFYPTSVMETGYEILFFWVARMIMLGIYSTGKVPFEKVYLHGLVRDALGEKMSKSRGNVIDPLNVINKYGADSLRFALVYGTSLGMDIKLSEKKIEGMRNFGNKLWNMARFLKINIDKFCEKGINYKPQKFDMDKLRDEDKDIINKFQKIREVITKNMENYKYAPVAEKLYEFIWHELADVYIEKIKQRLFANDLTALNVLYQTYIQCLTMLHPFMPFITEEINKQLTIEDTKPLIVSNWPS